LDWVAAPGLSGGTGLSDGTWTESGHFMDPDAAASPAGLDERRDNSVRAAEPAVFWGQGRAKIVGLNRQMSLKR
jgi:hypothetical protein